MRSQQCGPREEVKCTALINTTPPPQNATFYTPRNFWCAHNVRKNHCENRRHSRTRGHKTKSRLACCCLLHPLNPHHELAAATTFIGVFSFCCGCRERRTLICLHTICTYHICIMGHNMYVLAFGVYVYVSRVPFGFVRACCRMYIKLKHC